MFKEFQVKCRENLSYPPTLASEYLTASLTEAIGDLVGAYKFNNKKDTEITLKRVISVLMNLFWENGGLPDKKSWYRSLENGDDCLFTLMQLNGLLEGLIRKDIENSDLLGRKDAKVVFKQMLHILEELAFFSGISLEELVNE